MTISPAPLFGTFAQLALIGTCTQLALIGASIASVAGAATITLGLRMRAAARGDRAALGDARAREASLAEAARTMTEVARESTAAVRTAFAAAARSTCPGIEAILTYEEEDGALRCVHADGDRAAYYAGSLVALDDMTSSAVRALRSGHRDTAAPQRAQGAITERATGELAVPIAVQAGCRACVVVRARERFDAAAIERLVSLAQLVAPAYRLAQEREDDRRRAEYDGLTGLLAPRAFRRELSALTDRARYVPSHRFALLFVDTDRFKDWNDAYGHAAGDTLLRALARVLRSATRMPGDLVARNGGDEFCLVLTETAKADAIERAELLRCRIAALNLEALRPAHARTDVRITASIGVAAFPADAVAASTLLECADAAMYHSKETGRDAVAYAAEEGFIRLTNRTAESR